MYFPQSRDFEEAAGCMVFEASVINALLSYFVDRKLGKGVPLVWIPKHFEVLVSNDDCSRVRCESDVHGLPAPWTTLRGPVDLIYVCRVLRRENHTGYISR